MVTITISMMLLMLAPWHGLYSSPPLEKNLTLFKLHEGYFCGKEFIAVSLAHTYTSLSIHIPTKFSISHYGNLMGKHKDPNSGLEFQSRTQVSLWICKECLEMLIY